MLLQEKNALLKFADSDLNNRNIYHGNMLITQYRMSGEIIEIPST